MSLLFDAVVLIAAISVGIAYYKHKTTAAVVASAKKEATYLEGVASSVVGEAKIAIAGVVARLKAL